MLNFRKKKGFFKLLKCRQLEGGPWGPPTDIFKFFRGRFEKIQAEPTGVFYLKSNFKKSKDGLFSAKGKSFGLFWIRCQKLVLTLMKGPNGFDYEWGFKF